MTEDTIMPEECNFCTNLQDENDAAMVMGIAACDECAEKYRLDPEPFNAQVLGAIDGAQTSASKHKPSYH